MEAGDMIWQEYGKRLKDVLGLHGSPVSITYSLEAPGNAEECKVSVCKAILDVRDGKTINLTKETSGCRGGTWYLGLAPRPEGPAADGLKKFLVHGEKLFCSIAVFHRISAEGVQPPLGLANNVVFAPLDRAELEPDIVLFIVNPEQACRLIQLAAYWDGYNPKTDMVGAGCRMAITYPLVTGEMNVTFLDWTARRMRPYQTDELIVSVPYLRLKAIVEAIDRCSAGTAKLEIPPEFQAAVD
jgi:uncharacterized protein (DUF169 family)